MAKTRQLRLPHDVYVAVMRRIFVWTPQARAALQRETARLQCAQFGCRLDGARCVRCGREDAHG